MAGPRFHTLLPKLSGWIFFGLTLLLLGPIGFAVAMLDSRPGGDGADTGAKIVIALAVLGIAAVIGIAARAVTSLIIRALNRRG